MQNDRTRAVCRNTIRNYLRSGAKIRSKDWERTPGWWQSKSLLWGYKLNRFKLIIKLSMNLVKTIAGLLADLSKIGIENKALCWFSQKKFGTLEHVQTVCPALAYLNEVKVMDFLRITRTAKRDKNSEWAAEDLQRRTTSFPQQ